MVKSHAKKLFPGGQPQACGQLDQVCCKAGGLYRKIGYKQFLYVHIQETLQQNNLIFNNKQVKYLLQKNPTPPALNAQLKLHKPNIPIRPVVNNKNAPTYKTAKKLNDILKQCLCLDNRYNTINSTSLANDIVKLTINNKHRMITYDVKDL